MRKQKKPGRGKAARWHRLARVFVRRRQAVDAACAQVVKAFFACCPKSGSCLSPKEIQP